MTHFADRLQDRIDRLGNPTVMGLDPQPALVPPDILDAALASSPDPRLGLARAYREWNRLLIRSVSDVIPAVKPQVAYYELLGAPGMEVLEDTIAMARDAGMLVIADGKRNDIGSTAEAYAAAFLGGMTLPDGRRIEGLRADAVTLNAYLGSDGIRPFLEAGRANGAGVFVLVRTSNPGASEFQDLRDGQGIPLYARIAEQVDAWGADWVGESGLSAVGAVVGATWPSEARLLRGQMPRAIFLVPGYGAQGAGADDAVAGFREDGRGGLVNASRSLMGAWRKAGPEIHPVDAVRREALRMRDDLSQALDRCCPGRSR